MNTNNIINLFYKLMLCLLLILLVINSISANAISIEVNNGADQFSAVIRDINYPNELLERELNSGLQSNISVFLSVNQNNDNLFHCHTSFQITYDLWDEHYVINVVSNDNKAKSRIIKNLKNLLLLLKTITVNCNNVVTNTSNHAQYILSAQVLVNPVKAKRIEKIKDWIASSQGYSPTPDKIKQTPTINSFAHYSTTITVDSGKKIQPINQRSITTARPRFEKLFDKILQQYSGPNDIASLWRSEMATTSFFIESGKHEN